MSEDILYQLEEQLKDIEDNNNTENNENVQMRELIMQYLFNFYPNMQYDKFIKDNHVFLNFWLPEWMVSKSSLIFYFSERENEDKFIHNDNKGKVLSMISSDLPNIIPKYRVLCSYDDSNKKKKDELYEFVEKMKDFIERYSFMLKIANKINEKHHDKGTFQSSFNYDNDKRGQFFFFGYIPKIGNFHFNLTSDRVIIFAVERGLSKKIFNINSKKEDRQKWKELKAIEITPFIKITTELKDAFDIVYGKIEESIEHAFTFC